MVSDYFKDLWADLPDTARKQVACDIGANLCKGIVSSHVMFVFGILIASEIFACSVNQKSLIIGGNFIGLAGTLWYEPLAQRYLPSRNVQAALPAVLAAIGALLVACATSATTFVIACMLMGFMGALTVPALTAIWHHNYPTARRGQTASLAIWLRSLAGVLCGILGGLWLDVSIYNFRSLFIFFATVLVLSAVCTLKMPRVAQPEKKDRSGNKPVKLLKENRLVAKILGAWFLSGFAMHAILVQKTEYLLNPEYGLELSKVEIALYASALTEIARFVSMPFFARAFDKQSFIPLRLLVNSIFMLFLLCYFSTSYLPLIALASILHGLGQGGGMPLWSLWVTKFTTRERSGSLMSIHTFLTGLRGIAAPWLGYQLIAVSSIHTLAMTSLGLQAIATYGFYKLWHEGDAVEQRVVTQEEQ